MASGWTSTKPRAITHGPTSARGPGRDRERAIMILCVWRVSGPDFDVDAFLAANPRVRPERVWHRGERWLRRGTADSSGFNETVGEAKTAQEVLVGLRERGFEVLARAARGGPARREVGFRLYSSVGPPLGG